MHTVSTEKLGSLFFGNILASTWPNSKSKVSFDICWFRGFQNCPYFCYLAKQKLRYLRLKTPGVIFRIHIKMNQNFADLFLLDVTRQTFTLIYTLLALVKSFRHLYRRRRVNGYEILTKMLLHYFHQETLDLPIILQFSILGCDKMMCGILVCSSFIMTCESRMSKTFQSQHYKKDKTLNNQNKIGYSYGVKGFKSQK